MESVEILGVRIDNYDSAEALQQAKGFLDSSGQAFIFTPNPEMLVKAQQDGYFKETLNRGNLNICDGAGLVWAGLMSGKKITRVTGVDFMLDLCALAEQKKYSIYLLGSGSNEIVQQTADRLLLMFPNLKIAGYDRGPEVNDAPGPSDIGTAIVEKINAARPDILFVAFGMGKQEKWLRENLSLLPTVKIGMGVGGSFDFISGKIPRAPLLLRKMGLEWAYRLFKEPSRFHRIYNATVKFMYLVLKSQSPL